MVPTTNGTALVAVPWGVVTVTAPVTARAGTTASIRVALLIPNVAATPPNLTAVAPVKFVPKIVTVIEGSPVVGEKLEIVGTVGVTEVWENW